MLGVRGYISIDANRTPVTEDNVKVKQTDSTAIKPPDDSDHQPSKDEEFEALYHNVCPPQSAGRESTTATTLSDNSVFIVNGLSSLGARVAYALGTKWNVLSIASTKDRMSTNQLMWYRLDMLKERGISNVFVDWSDSHGVMSLLRTRTPNHVIIIPPGIDGTLVNDLDSTVWADALHDFVALLEAVKTITPTTRLTVVSTSKSVKNELEVVAPSGKHSSLLETLVGAFDLSMSTYHTLYHIPFSVLRFNGFYGPWIYYESDLESHNKLDSSIEPYTGCYIDDIVGIMYSALSLRPQCIVLDYGLCDGSYTSQYALNKVAITELADPDKGGALTEAWRSEYENRKREKFVLTSYFTGRRSSINPNRFRNLQTWLQSVMNHGLDAVVLHDGLNTDFITRAKKHYPRLSFELISLPYDFGENSTQTIRAFSRYLENQRDVDRVIIMDLDKTLTRNVFPAMEYLGDWLYSDLDIMSFYDMISRSQNGSNALITNSMVVGGSKHIVLATLNRMVSCLDSQGFQCLMNEHFVQHAFLGWPLSTSIRR